MSNSSTGEPRSAVEPRRHLLIAGAGRSGTSLLVRILNACGFETELSANANAFWDETASAGLETIPLLEGKHPYVVKSPWSYQFIRQLLDDPAIRLDGVLIPVRRLEEASASRIVLEIQQMYRSQPGLLDLEDDWTTWGTVPGGITYSVEPLDVKRVLAHGFYRLIEALVEREISICFLAFPRFCTDLAYLRRTLEPILPADLNEATLRERIGRLIEPDKIRVEEEITALTNHSLREIPEMAYPDLSTLHRVSLKREVKRFSADLAAAQSKLQTIAGERDKAVLEMKAALSERASKCDQRYQELQERASEISQLKAAVSERNKDNEGLQRQTDSIHGSISWRLTWPIRWFHKQITSARKVLSKTRQ
jgi:hypothetical protein